MTVKRLCKQLRSGVLIVALMGFSLLQAGVGSVAYAESATPSPLPFSMPSTATLRSSKKLVFAHYYTPHTISLDNKDASSDYYTQHFLPPGDSQYAKYGGMTRERPLARSPIKTTATNPDARACPLPNAPEYRLQDMRTDVRNAINAGIDGFAVDILQLPGDPDFRVCQSVFILLQAAQLEDPNFKIMLMPDMSGGVANVSATVLADFVAKLAQYPSAYHLPDGRLAVSPFQPEHGHNAQWWKDFVGLMRSSHGVSVAFVPCFVTTPSGSELDTYASFSYGLSHWGNRNPAFNNSTNLSNAAAKAHDRGLIWMQPVSLQDVRPRSAIYDEANNTENLRDTWTGAINNNAEWVQLTTWNDYSEGSEFAPSTHMGWNPLDISAYYLTRFKTGSWPTITRDAVYVSHRVQPASAKPTGGQSVLMQLRKGSSPARDTVEVLAFLTAGSTVRTTIGNTTQMAWAPAGVSTQLVALQPGIVTARVERSSVVTASVTSPYSITNTPKYQDLHYYFAGSGRDGTSATTVPPVTSTWDRTPPSVPVDFHATKATATSVSLAWGSSTDNVGVKIYHIYRGSKYIGQTTGTSYIDYGLKPGVTYSYAVRAFDIANNYSLPACMDMKTSQ